jgi:hypothetical protein
MPLLQEQRIPGIALNVCACVCVPMCVCMYVFVCVKVQESPILGSIIYCQHTYLGRSLEEIPMSQVVAQWLEVATWVRYMHLWPLRLATRCHCDKPWSYTQCVVVDCVCACAAIAISHCIGGCVHCHIHSPSTCAGAPPSPCSCSHAAGSQSQTSPIKQQIGEGLRSKVRPSYLVTTCKLCSRIQVSSTDTKHLLDCTCTSSIASRTVAPTHLACCDT